MKNNVDKFKSDNRKKKNLNLVSYPIDKCYDFSVDYYCFEKSDIDIR